MSKPANQLNTPEARFKGAVTSLKNLKEKVSEEEYQAALRELLDLPEEVGDEVVYASDSEAIEVLRQGQQEEERDYTRLLASLEHQIAEVEDLWTRATAQNDRNAYQRRLHSLRYMIRVVEAATKIAPGERIFGCRKSATMTISGRNTGFPDIKFRYHTFRTSDPLLVARLLDYIENPLPGDPPIEPRRPGDVALVDDKSGRFSQWVPGRDAEDVIATSRGAFRRPYR